jgi:hypothetical protein
MILSQKGSEGEEPMASERVNGRTVFPIERLSRM